MYLEVLDKFIDIYSNISYLTAVVTAGTATRAAGSAQSVAPMEEHFDTLSRGIFDSRDMIYFCSISAIFLTLAKFFICKSRF